MQYVFNLYMLYIPFVLILVIAIKQKSIKCYERINIFTEVTSEILKDMGRFLLVRLLCNLNIL